MTPIEPLILQLVLLASRAWDVEAPLILAIIDVESGFNFHAVGDHDAKGVPQAYGLMMLQLTGAGHGWNPDDLFNPALNIFVGTEYLKFCINTFPNNLKLAISCYNQGPGGAAQRGYGATGSYVTNVLNLKKKYTKEVKGWLKKSTP